MVNFRKGYFTQMKLLVATIGCMLLFFGNAITKRAAHLQEAEAKAEEGSLDVDAIFEQFDANGDGKITPKEVAKASRGTGRIGENF